MNLTGIEWTDRTWNPVVGCLNGCPYCYAEALTRRFPKQFPKGFAPTFVPKRLDEPDRLKEPSKIFVCSMGDLFGEWVPDAWIREVFRVVRANPRHTFQFLTKNPYRYPEVERTIGLPERAWYGATVDSLDALYRIDALRMIDRRRFVSFEPLTQFIEPDLRGVQWAIVGGRSAANGLPAVVPEPEWIQAIEDAAGRANIPLFVKKNAGNDGPRFWPPWPQEFPEGSP